MKNQTAVEWLVEQYKKVGGISISMSKQAKEMEKEQSHKYAEFAIICDRKDMKILEFDGYINLETFKSEQDESNT
jgi:hypothetical protein